MKVNIEFNMEEDRYEYDIFKQSMSLHRFVGEFKAWLRSEYKYAEHDEKAMDMLEKIREEFFKLAGEHNINFDL